MIYILKIELPECNGNIYIMLRPNTYYTAIKFNAIKSK